MKIDFANLDPQDFEELVFNASRILYIFHLPPNLSFWVTHETKISTIYLMCIAQFFFLIKMSTLANCIFLSFRFFEGFSSFYSTVELSSSKHKILNVFIVEGIVILKGSGKATKEKCIGQVFKKSLSFLKFQSLINMDISELVA